ncbi:MAG: tetratricopeptide repeat protein [Leptolyngbyaceae cyanobacterium bins.349]|nr:tetratricopeptide repeat protein [Leptolyngbyaceae cyanobacterium bins.349]
MAKKSLTKLVAELNKPALFPEERFQANLQSLLTQQKYRQALDEIQRIRRSHPDIPFTPSEAEIWLLRGQQEVEEENFRQAETSLRRSLQLGLVGESHYWLAKALLALDRLDEAIALIQAAFEDGSLPKDYSICYAKLLFLKGDTEAVENLLKKKTKFWAAQQHWIRGVLALKANQPEAAIASFQKIKQPVTPGDQPKIWQIYTQQILQNWDAAAAQLGLNLPLNPFGNPFARIAPEPAYTTHPLLQRLALLQHFKTGKPSLESMIFSGDDELGADILDIANLLEYVDDNNLHEAAHVLAELDRAAKKYPEIAVLRPALLALAGQQAIQEGSMNCAAQFWQQLLREDGFSPQLAVNLMKVLDLNEDYPELQRLLTRTIKWVEQDYKNHPQNWTEKRYKEALVYAHCRLADTWSVMGRRRTAMGELRNAERIDPRSPEIIGRHGLVAVMDGNLEEATRLLTEALEGGCRFQEVYTGLIDTWKQLGNSAAATDVRRRFGKKFGDLNVETEVELAPWEDAFLTGSYLYFSRLVQESRDRDPGVRACQIFVAAAGQLTPGGKIPLDQTQAEQQWEALLQSLTPPQQVPALQAIGLCIQLFAKREKGIAALLSQYMAKLIDLSMQQPEAKIAQLTLLVLKERDRKRLEMPIEFYLSKQPQPGNALAAIQLQVRRYTQTVAQDQILRPFLDAALQREPQNPLLLLAKATTFPPGSKDYEKFHQQGFEIARRVQDAKALQAFRVEETVISAKMAQNLLPAHPNTLDNFDMEDMDQMLEQLIRTMLGGKVPPAELKRMLPQLKQMMMNDMPPAFGDDDDDFDFGFPFGGFPLPSNKPPKRKRK